MERDYKGRVQESNFWITQWVQYSRAELLHRHIDVYSEILEQCNMIILGFKNYSPTVVTIWTFLTPLGLDLQS